MEDELIAIVMELRRHFASLYGERLETTYRHFALTNEAEVRAWIQSMLHARTWDALTVSALSNGLNIAIGPNSWEISADISCHPIFAHNLFP